MKRRIIYLFLACVSLSSCVTPVPEKYTVSRDSLFFLQQLPPTKVSVGAIAGDPDFNAGISGSPVFLTCRGSPELKSVDAAGTYIRTALIEELKSGGLYVQEDGRVHIRGTVERFTLTRGFLFEAEWTIGLQLQSSTGAEISIHRTYKFDIGSLAGPSTCERAMENLEPAIRTLLEELIRSEKFKQLLSFS